MTRRGLGFTIVAVLVYLAGNQTRIGWLYLIAAFMLAVLALAWLLPRLWTRGLSATRTVTQPVHEGDQAEVTLRLQKRGFASYLTLVQDRSPLDNQDHTFLVPRVTAEPTTITYTASCYKRGRYTLPPPVAENTGLLGLFRQSSPPLRGRVGERGQSVTVYPWYLPEAQWQAGERRPALMLGSGRSGVGAGLLGTREYRPGDPLRHIHWRSSARRDTLVVKEFEEEWNPGLALVLNTSRELGEGRDTTLEYSVKLAATLARYATAMGRPFRLLTWPQPREALTWRAMLEFLTDLKQIPDGPRLHALVSRLAPGEQTVVASPDLASAAEALSAHHRRGASVLAVRFTGFGQDKEVPVPVVEWPKGGDPAKAIQAVLAAL